MTGIMRSSLPGLDGASAFDAIAKTAFLGLDACLFSSLLDLAPTLDPVELDEVKAHSDQEGVAISAGAGWINPARPERGADVAALVDGDFAKGMDRLIESAARLGLTDLFFMMGVLEDRFDPDPGWSRQLELVVGFLRDLAPVLRANGIRLLLKTHEEIKTFEIIRLIDRVGADVLGVAFDPVNVLVRLEDPVAAAQRVAPFVGQVHLDDATVAFDRRVLKRWLCSAGTGAIDWRQILELKPSVPRYIDLHRGQFSMPAFTPEFIAREPELSVMEFASVCGMAARDGGRRLDPPEVTPERLDAALAFFVSPDFRHGRSAAVEPIHQTSADAGPTPPRGQEQLDAIHSRR